jgi:hypothetical protein
MNLKATAMHLNSKAQFNRMSKHLTEENQRHLKPFHFNPKPVTSIMQSYFARQKSNICL